MSEKYYAQGIFEHFFSNLNHCGIALIELVFIHSELIQCPEQDCSMDVELMDMIENYQKYIVLIQNFKSFLFRFLNQI